MGVDDDRPEVRALISLEEWRSCGHARVGLRDHSCPDCGATMRRCCASQVVGEPHRADCPEVLLRKGA